MGRVLQAGLLFVAGTLAGLGGPSSAQAAGEEVDGYPNWEERVYLQLANRARVEPSLEMTECGSNCPDAACYSPQPPLTHGHELARAARFHSQEMVVRGFFSHTSDCTLVEDIAEIWPESCDGSAECACVGGVAECEGACTSAQSRVGLFGSGYGGEIIVGGGGPWGGFYLWLHEPSTSEDCVFGNGNGHRWLLLTSQGSVGFGSHANYGTGDFGFGGGGDDGPIPSGTHYPRVGSSVDAYANWYAEAAPTLTTVNVDGTCQPMALERGDDRNGTWHATLDGLDPQACHRYFFVFKDEAGQTVTYPSSGSLGIGPAMGCPEYSEDRPALGDGCDCTPVCDGAQCGDDGCGGSCGTCGDDASCADGLCVPIIDPEGEASGTDAGDGTDGGETGDAGPGSAEPTGGAAEETSGPGPGDSTDGDGHALPPSFGGSQDAASGCSVSSDARSRGGALMLLLLLGWGARSNLSGRRRRCA